MSGTVFFELRVKLITACMLALLCGSAQARAAGHAGYSPYADTDYPVNLYWGDTHLHTNLSADAFGFGNTLTPEQSYAFARGETVTANSGQRVRLRRPLDFLVVADHAEFLGLSALLEKHSELLDNSAIGQRWLAFLREGNYREILLDTQRVTSGKLALSHDRAIDRRMWDQVIDAADRHNDPGRFTAFIGYEWTSLPDGNNLHRNVVFRDGGERAGKVLPFSALDSRNPEDLWRYLQEYEELTGGRVLAIPHNANVSNGLMFSDRSYDGKPLDPSLAAVRARWEPIVEVTQIKGDGEAHPYLSPEDDFADFETWDHGNFALPAVPKEKRMLRHEYARSALKLGLELESGAGVNPFRFGMIGSSDSHIALSAVEENNFFGKFGIDEPSSKRLRGEPVAAARYAAAGYAAVWARENTREALFDAIQRREAYATTGPRIVLHFFGGWHFDARDDTRPDYAAIGYQKGVPMGGDLGSAPEEGAPTFLVVAGKDPDGANLDRVQIVKGWLERDGRAREKIYDVAASGNRPRDPETGSVAPLKSTVDETSASYTNTVGTGILHTVWTDPDFDPGERAFYYVRVLEIPTPRWSTYDAAFYGVDLPADYPAQIQERAYSSPIWYSPP